MDHIQTSHKLHDIQIFVQQLFNDLKPNHSLTNTNKGNHFHQYQTNNTVKQNRYLNDHEIQIMQSQKSTQQKTLKKSILCY